VAPAELEALLLTDPGLADAAVIGRLDARLHEIPVAPGDELHADAVLAWVAERVAIRVADALPKTPSGKLRRRVLHE
jgi:acyl-coenzyme A synthetase/AMP-(fatty) acid ligase